MNERQYQLELAAFDEKIALAKLEVAKAAVRSAEIEFEKKRFLIDVLLQKFNQEDKKHETISPSDL